MEGHIRLTDRDQVHPVIQFFINTRDRIPDLDQPNDFDSISTNFWLDHPGDRDPIIKKFIARNTLLPNLNCPSHLWEISQELPSENWLDTICYYAANFFSRVPQMGPAAIRYCESRGRNFLIDDVKSLVKDLDVEGIQQEIQEKQARRIAGLDPEAYTRSVKEQELFDAINARPDLKKTLIESGDLPYPACICGRTNQEDIDALSYKIKLFDVTREYESIDGVKDDRPLSQSKCKLSWAVGFSPREDARILADLQSLAVEDSSKNENC